MATERIIELMKKLHALSERGEGGEKLNAERMLASFLKKHNMSVEDLVGEKVQLRELWFVSRYQWLARQIVARELGRDFRMMKYKKQRGFKLVECTAAQFVSIQSQIDFFVRAFEKELEFFQEAFIRKMDLGVSSDDSGDDQPVDLERLLKVLSMAESIEKQSYRKQIGGGDA